MRYTNPPLLQPSGIAEPVELSGLDFTQSIWIPAVVTSASIMCGNVHKTDVNGRKSWRQLRCLKRMPPDDDDDWPPRGSVRVRTRLVSRIGSGVRVRVRTRLVGRIGSGVRVNVSFCASNTSNTKQHQARQKIAYRLAVSWGGGGQLSLRGAYKTTFTIR